MGEEFRWGSVFAQASVEFVDIPSPIGPLGALEVTLQAPGGQAPATLCLGVPAARHLWAALDDALRERLAEQAASRQTASPPPGV
jgi:hypothetical protein